MTSDKPKQVDLHGEVVIDENTLAYQFPELVSEWNYEKNSLEPEDYRPYSDKKVWWKCSKGHEWEARIRARTKHSNGCPYCWNEIQSETISKMNRSRALKKSGSLLENYPEIATEWDYEKNELEPSEIPPKSNLKVWWKCLKGHEWQTRVIDRAKGHGCPKCYFESRRKK